MRTALLSLPSAAPADDLPASTSPTRPAAVRPHLRPSRQVQRAYVRQRFVAGWCAINPAVGRAIRRHRARTAVGERRLVPLRLLQVLAVS